MKSTAKNRNLVKMAAMSCTLFALSAGSYSQLNSADAEAAQRLDKLMISTEESIRFTAPVVNDVCTENGELTLREKTYVLADEISGPAAKNVFLVESSEQRKAGDQFLQKNHNLVQVGYYQHIRPTVWSRIMNVVRKSHGKQIRGCKIYSLTYIM